MKEFNIMIGVSGNLVDSVGFDSEEAAIDAAKELALKDKVKVRILQLKGLVEPTSTTRVTGFGVLGD